MSAIGFPVIYKHEDRDVERRNLLVANVLEEPSWDARSSSP